MRKYCHQGCVGMVIGKVGRCKVERNRTVAIEEKLKLKLSLNRVERDLK